MMSVELLAPDLVIIINKTKRIRIKRPKSTRAAATSRTKKAGLRKKRLGYRYLK